MSYSVEVVRTPEAIQRVRSLWDAMPWEREEAEADYLLTRVRERGATPFGILIHDGGKPAGAVAARVEQRRLTTSLGYRTLYAPEVQALHIVDGGLYARDASALALVGRTLAETLAAGAIEVLAVPALPVDSPLLAALESAGRPQRLIVPWARRRLELPASFDEFLASRTRKIRSGIRYDAKKLIESYGDDLELTVLRAPDDLDRFTRDLDSVARLAYQRAVGGGFVSDPEQRELARVGLERGWLRAYLLSIAGVPAAYWLVATYNGTLLLKTTGYDPAYARDRVGIYLLMRVIEDACADPSLQILDFGPGDASYKRHFSDESFEERNALVYASTLRATRINLIRTGLLGAGLVARRALDASGLTGRLRSGWRARRQRAT